MLYSKKQLLQKLEHKDLCVLAQYVALRENNSQAAVEGSAWEKRWLRFQEENILWDRVINKAMGLGIFDAMVNMADIVDFLTQMRQEE